MGNYDVFEVLLGYEPSVRASNSTVTVIEDSSKVTSLVLDQPASESSPPRRFGLELQDVIISFNRNESIISQLTSSAEADYNGSSDYDKFSVLSTTMSEGPSRRQYFQDHDVKKPKGINRRIRKAASRLMSVVAPSRYPKSRHRRTNAVISTNEV